MNELEKQLAKIVEKSLEVAERTGEFVIEQAPELLQEFYMWHTASYILGIILCVAVLAVISAFVVTIGKKNDWDFREEVVFFSVVFGVIGGLVSLVFLFTNIYNLTFVLIAPKLYLIEYFLA